MLRALLGCQRLPKIPSSNSAARASRAAGSGDEKSLAATFARFSGRYAE